jgi:hypothetical protein
MPLPLVATRDIASLNQNAFNTFVGDLVEREIAHLKIEARRSAVSESIESDLRNYEELVNQR